VLFDLR